VGSITALAISLAWLHFTHECEWPRTSWALPLPFWNCLNALRLSSGVGLLLPSFLVAEGLTGSCFISDDELELEETVAWEVMDAEVLGSVI